jgi:hypothetical protein
MLTGSFKQTGVGVGRKQCISFICAALVVLRREKNLS